MASLFKLGNGWACDVFGVGRIRLGKNKSDAAHIFRQIEKIEQAKRAGVELGALTVDWIRNAPPPIIKRLTHLGLIDKRVGHTLGDLLRAFRDQPGKASSVRIRRNAADKLEQFFKASTPLIDIRPADAQAYRDWLLTKGKHVAKGKPPAGLEGASVARQIKWGRTIFNRALENGWVASNPFSSITTGKMVNAAKAHFVPGDVARRIIDELPGPQMRLIFALGRWGGLRLPSEVVEFRWSGIDWAKWSMTFRSIKTEGHEGGEKRTCPIFREIQPYLLQAWEVASEGSDFVFTELRDSGKDPRQYIAHRVEQALKRLGLKPWPRLLSNLRATRATEIDKEFGAKCESEWIGHGAVTALKHYLMITTDDWARATGVEKPEQNRIVQPENKGF